jgi:uncharacterized protein YjiS (DUF1127 family)
MHRVSTISSVTAGVVLRLTRRPQSDKTRGRAGHQDLAMLNDHVLRDHGLRRVDIDHVIRGKRRL